MARDFRLLSVLFLVVACLVASSKAESATTAPTTVATTTVAPTTEAPTTALTTEAPTTKAPTTEAPTTAPTTEAPTTAPTTEAPTTAPTTEAPTTAPTTKAPTTAPTTKAPTPEVTTPGGTKPTAEPTTETPTPAPTAPDPCKPDPCKDGSTCLPRFGNTFECLCPAGAFYDSTREVCETAKVYPVNLTLPNTPFSTALEDQGSKEFGETSLLIIEQLHKAFTPNPDYFGSIVVSFGKVKSSRVLSRVESGVLAVVDNVFNTDAEETNDKVADTVKTHFGSITEGTLSGATIEGGSLCGRDNCDSETTECTPETGSFVCKCKEGYIKTTHSTTMCIACPSGQKLDPKTKKCVDCPFGRSGFNCNESWELILVIVGSVLGALLLGSIIAVALVARKPAKKRSKKNKDENVTTFSTKAPLVSNSTANGQAAPVNAAANAYANAGVPRIPRATTASSLDRRTNLEMTPSNSRQNLGPAGRNPRLYDDPDDLSPYGRSRPQSSNYAQSKPQNNPYAQTRPQSNPYNSNQGYANPYYKHDNGRPLY